VKEFADAQWGRATRALDSAEKLVSTDPDSAASRASYAAFHAVTAVFAVRGHAFTKHSALRAALHRDLIYPGLVSPEIGKDFDFLGA